MPDKKFRVTTPMPPLPTIEESELSLFDPDSPDINLFNLVDEEIIRLSGSKLLVYKYFQSDKAFDPVYMEERNKTIAKEPVILYGHYDPRVLDENLGEFGIELTNDQIFIFNKSYAERNLGRRLIPGDVIKPEFQDQKYEIFEVQEDSFEVYGVYHLNCHAKLLRDAPQIQDEPIDHETNPVGGYDGLGG